MIQHKSVTKNRVQQQLTTNWIRQRNSQPVLKKKKKKSSQHTKTATTRIIIMPRQNIQNQQNSK